MSTLRTIAANARGGLSLGARIAAGAWTVDAIVLAADVARKGTDPLASSIAALIAAGAYGLVAIGLGVALAVAAAYLGGSEPLGPRARARNDAIRAALGATDPTWARAFAARSVAALLALVAAAAAAIPIALAATADVRTPVYSAALACAVAFGALAAAAAAWPIWIRTGTLIARIPPRLPRPAILLAGGAALAAIGAGAAVAATWDRFGFALPWRGPLLALALLAAGIAWFAFDLGRRVLPRRVRRALLAARVLLPVAGVVAAVLLPRSLVRVGAILDDATGPISAARSLVERALDFDGDGYLSILGEGDCAPHDPARHPGARDVPNDGVDQDCSGADRKTAIVLAKARRDYPATPAPGPMPIVLVTIDSVSAADLDLYGAARATMPALARWARSAAVFDRAFSVGPSTRLTLPSLATGRYLAALRHKPKPRAHGAWAAGNVTLAEILGRAGYRTIAVAPDPYFSRTVSWVYQGFTEKLFDPAKGPDGLTASLVTEAALRALRTAGPRDKLFLWAHYSDAHMAKKAYVLPSGMSAFPGGTPKDGHDTKLLYVDAQLARLLAGVAEIFGDAPRLVIVTADHGESFNPSHARKSKARHAWDLSTSVTRVPLAIASPWGGPRRTARVANTIDVAATILNAVGLGAARSAADLQGDSLLPTLATGADPRRPILQQMFIPERLADGGDPLYREAVRRDELVLYRIGATYSLYDYVADPGEDRDLFAERPDAASDLAEIMLEMSGATRGWTAR